MGQIQDLLLFLFLLQAQRQGAAGGGGLWHSQHAHAPTYRVADEGQRPRCPMAQHEEGEGEAGPSQNKVVSVVPGAAFPGLPPKSQILRLHTSKAARRFIPTERATP